MPAPLGGLFANVIVRTASVVTAAVLLSLMAQRWLNFLETLAMN